MSTYTIEEYQQHVDNYDGFCRVCCGFTRDGSTEPDAENYECPVCDGMTVCGAENALILGLFSFANDD